MTPVGGESALRSRSIVARLLGIRAELPVVMQMTAADCGAACLAMVLEFHGRAVRLDEIRTVLGESRDGTNAKQLVDAAEMLGLRAKGIRLDVGDLGTLPRASLLHWEFRHFVVFDGRSASGVYLIDPAVGRRHVPMQDFRRAFTGVALILQPGPDFSPAQRGRSLFWSYLASTLTDRANWARVMLTSVLLQSVVMVLPLVLGIVVDQVAPARDRELLTALVAAVAISLGLGFLATLVRSYLLVEIRTKLDVRATVGFVEHLVSLPFAFFQRRHVGDLATRIGSNAAIQEILTGAALAAALDGTLVIGYLSVLALVGPLHMAMVVLMAIAQAAVILASWNIQRELTAQSIEQAARCSTLETELLLGMETLKTLGTDREIVARWTDAYVDRANIAMRRARLTGLLDACFWILRAGGPLVLLLVGAYLVLDGQLTVGSMLGLNALAIGMLVPLGALVSLLERLPQVSTLVSRLDDVYATGPERHGTSSVPALPEGGHLVVDGVTHWHGPETNDAVLDGVSLEFPAGSVTLIVGTTGSGKSTLASVLVGLLRPSRGRVLYNGVDLKDADPLRIREQLGVVTQHPYLFSGTIRSNIAAGSPGLSLDAVENAARAAHVFEEIARMPLGFDTPVVAGGTSLSGGQRQRIALARALARCPALLVMDEATSALDPMTEHIVLSNLARLGCTRILIGHRPQSTVVDQVVVMEGGRVVEIGAPADLTSRRSKYRDLMSAAGAGR